MQPRPWRGCLFLGFDSPQMVDVATRRLGRVTQQDAATSDLRRENHCRTLNALPVVILAPAAPCERLCLSRSSGFSNKEIFSLRLGKASVNCCYGTAVAGDDRQGNEARRGDAAGLSFIGLCAYQPETRRSVFRRREEPRRECVHPFDRKSR